ncbi:succinylglutamate desuccinylase/aspartoacylase [Natronolimnohabitans innermongolicus JCM 12255]|uniref:Succinylglutamate desuccinylase/aspartoacylase n=2 Tax=Natronolimnohabitans innermongolicus TaxID=253107 RepID=L9XGU1_9EURY|nr:succinylglutamate desuccinylase/aspartoacylase [Natronolimnohabitans innermongolicus JCM 12255]
MVAVGGAQDGNNGDDGGNTRESFTIRDGTAEETTVHVTTAEADGPTAVVLGGVHGNEVAGYVAANAIVDWQIDAGTLVTIPEASAIAVDRGTRTDDDGIDLNRQFPEGETPETQLAREIWAVVADYDADVVIDLHESTGLYAGDPVDGVGQAIFRSDGGWAVAAANDAAEYTTRNYVDDPELAFQTGSFSGPDSDPMGLLVHKAARDLGSDAFLVETISTDVDLETRVQWHSAIVERLLTNELLLDEPANGHGPDEDESADEDDTDDTDDGDESDAADDTEDDADDADDDDSAAADSPVPVIETCPENVDELALESGQTVELDASGSHAPDSEIVTHEWDVGQTEQFDKSGETLEVTVGSNGRDTVVLRVVDDDGATATESITLSTK